MSEDKVVQTPKRQPPVNTAAADADVRVEKILADLVDKFRYDAMQDEIRRAVRQELESGMPQRSTGVSFSGADVNGTLSGSDISAEQPAAAPDKTAAEEVQETPQTEETQTQEEAPDTASEGAPAEESVPALDISALLAMQAQQLSDSSPIDTMELYGEECVEVTLEELAKYNARKK